MITLYDNNFSLYSYNDYKKYCEDNDLPLCSEDSEQYNNWLNDSLESDYKDFRSTIDNCKITNRNFIIDCYIHLWNRKIENSYVVTSLPNTISNCFRGCDHVTVKLTNEGFINITASHHDGTNFFTIKMLNKNGERWAEATHRNQKDLEYTKYWISPIKTNDIILL